jgi:hypothetical protein
MSDKNYVLLPSYGCVRFVLCNTEIPIITVIRTTLAPNTTIIMSLLPGTGTGVDSGATGCAATTGAMGKDTTSSARIVYVKVLEWSSYFNVMGLARDKGCKQNGGYR